MDLFAVQIQQEALRLEESGFLTSLEYEIRSTAEIKSLFSFLIYIKGKDHDKYRCSFKLFIDVEKTNTYSQLNIYTYNTN